MHQKKFLLFVFTLCLLTFSLGDTPIKAQNFINSPKLKSSPNTKNSIITKDIQAAMERISATSLESHVSFLASDLLEGRGTPSKGLDIAAEYIASQFRRSGLEPINKSYFQVSDWIFAEPLTGTPLTIKYQDQTLTTDSYTISLFNYFDRDIKIENAEVVVLSDEDLAKSTLPSNLENKVLLIPAKSKITFNLILKIAKSKALLCIRSLPAQGQANAKAQLKSLKLGRLIHKEEKQEANSVTPSIIVDDPKMLEAFEKLQTASIPSTISINIPSPKEKIVKLKNVVGMLKGSDPVLKDTYLILSAHYDHLGIVDSEEDSIFNGANDNASGTASLMEIADTLAKLKKRPKRSILFITFFGEEKGLYGSDYYVENPLVPLEKTIVNINLEQLGRSDSNDGSTKDTMSLTGFDFSDVGSQFKLAGELTGIKAYKHEEYSDLFFGASDNVKFAQVGIPAHTLCTAYTFANYHKADDHADKIDYENMAKVNKSITLGLTMIANNPLPPKWKENLPETKRYVEAWKKLQNKN
jgi:hypothetical protein